MWLGSAPCSFTASPTAAFSLGGDCDRDESEDDDLDLVFGASPFWSGSIQQPSDVLDFTGDFEPDRDREEPQLLLLSCLLCEMPGSLGGGA